MADEKKARVYRTKEERKAEIDKKIQYHKDCIKVLEDKKKAIDNPRKPGARQKGLKRIIAEGKLSDEETAKAIGISVEELRERLLKAASEKE